MRIRSSGRLLNLLFISIIALYSNATWAACGTTPITYGACTKAGQIQWDATNAALVYCNGTNYVSMQGSGTLGSCSGSKTSQLEWDAGSSNYKYCDGTNWIPVANNGNVGTCSKNQEITYDSTNNVMTWCNGTVTVDTTATSGSKCVFITSGTYKGNLGGVTGADAICQGLADTQGGALAGKTWMAWISSSATDDPESRFTHYGGNYELVDGTVIANSWTDLTDGSLDNPINLDEAGSSPSGPNEVWTGTYQHGGWAGSAYDCSSWSSGGGGSGLGTGGFAGDRTLTNYRWSISQNWKCGTSLSLYCFEQ